MFSTWDDYREFKDLTGRTTSDKILGGKTFNFAKNPKYDGFQREPALIVYTVFGKNTPGTGIKDENMLNKELPDESHKPIIKKFEKRKSKLTFYR